MRQNILLDSYLSYDLENETDKNGFFEDLLIGIKGEHKREIVRGLIEECLTSLPFVVMRRGYLKTPTATDCFFTAMIRVIAESGLFSEMEMEHLSFNDMLCMMTRHTLGDLMIDRFNGREEDFLSDFVFQTGANVEKNLYEFDFTALEAFCKNSEKWSFIDPESEMFSVMVKFIIGKLKQEQER